MVAEIAPQSKKEALEKAMQEVGYMQPTPTKKVKGVFGTKEVPKTEEELQRDRDVALAQSIINDRERLLAEAKEKATALSDEAERTASQILGTASKEAEEIKRQAEWEVKEIKRKEQESLKALRNARKELLKDIRDSLPPPPIEAAQRAIECAKRARREQIEMMIEQQQEAQKPKKKIHMKGIENMTEILVFAKNQTVDVELAGVERNSRGRIINDNADCRQNRYEHAENTILFVTLYQTTISASTSFASVYELVKELVCAEWGFMDYIDIKLVRDIGSVWSFYLTLTTEDYITDYAFISEIDEIDCEVLQ